MKRCLVLLVFACGPKSTPPAESTLSNTVDEDVASDRYTPPGLTDGALWTCSIDAYDPLPCRFTRSGDGWALRKLMGSQRFEGTASFTRTEMAFDGTFFCPWGDCTVPMVTTFQEVGQSHYTAEVEGWPVDLRWDADLAREWGGAGYGGLTGDEE